MAAALKFTYGGVAVEDMDSQPELQDSQKETEVVVMKEKRKTIVWSEEKQKYLIQQVLASRPWEKSESSGLTTESLRWGAVAHQLSTNDRSPLHGETMSGESVKARVKTIWEAWTIKYHGQGVNTSGHNGDIDDPENYKGVDHLDWQVKKYDDVKKKIADGKDTSLKAKEEDLKKNKKHLQSSMLNFSSRSQEKFGAFTPASTSGATTGTSGTSTGSSTVSSNTSVVTGTSTIRSNSPFMVDQPVDPIMAFVVASNKRKADDLELKKENDRAEMKLKEEKQAADIEMARRQMALEERKMALEEAKLQQKN